jgi:cation-transporting P-type ATPase C
MIDQIRLIHSLPGRTRIRLSVQDLTAAQVEAKFRIVPFIYSVMYSRESRSLVLYHDPSIPWKHIKEYIQKRFGRFTNEKPKQGKGQVQVKKHLKDVLCASAALLFNHLFVPFSARVGLGKLINIPALTVMYISYGIIRSGLQSILRDRRANADTLTATAILASLLKGKPGSGLVIIIMSSISELLTEYTAERTRNYVTNMLKLDVPFVWLVDEDGREKKVPIETIKPGDTISVFLGEKISVDGMILDGDGSVDESSITGEFMPREISKESYVYAGSILKSGQVNIKVKHVGDNTAITRIIKLIEEAQSKQAPIQSYADRMSSSLVPISFLMAGIVYMLTRNWDRVLNMLFIDFSCGLKLSTATAISASIGKAAKNGILIKGGQYIEQLARVDTVVLDKTGTVTEGRPTVRNVYSFNGFTPEDVIRYSAPAEEHSSHPIAESIVQQANLWNVEIPDHGQIETIVGRGIKAVVEGKIIIVGSHFLMEESGVDLGILEAESERSVYKQEGENIVYVACEGQLIGIVSIHDPIRHGMKKAINRLRRYDIDEIVMLTGDNKETARKISDRLYLDSFNAEVLPADKAEFIKRYRQKGSSVMMVGDGINDAPALAYADVGVTMGNKRTDIAVETSDVTITSDDPLALPAVVNLSRNTMKVIHQNFFATIIVNSIAILLGAMGTITPVVGAVIHNTATISVVLNSSKILLMEIKNNGR